jgi:outer membrane lipoprotein-sorting protein
MKNKLFFLIIVIVVGVAGFLTLYFLGPSRQPGPSEPMPQTSSDAVTSKPEPPVREFKDEPVARALYKKMIETMRAAESLSYTSNYNGQARGEDIGHSSYTIWLKKPNYFRVETAHADGSKGGTLVGDGNDLWIFWPGDRPFFSSEDKESYEKTRSNVYMREATPLAKHSIGHKDSLLGTNLMMVFDPSTFHGYTDSLQPYIDGVTSLGTEKIEDQACDGIEVSIMKGQRIWQLWLSKQDHLPRKLKQIVHVSYDLIMNEQWSQVTINAEIQAEKFVWQPPEGWQQWRLPSPDELLLKPGQESPDFELLAADGRSKIKLSDYRGKTVWLYIWRAG